MIDKKILFARAEEGLFLISMNSTLSYDDPPKAGRRSPARAGRKKGVMPMPDAVYRGVLKTYNFGSATNSLSWPDLKRVRAAR